MLSVVIFRSHEVSGTLEALSFGAALELSIAMPLSWLPVISDYTRQGKKPVKNVWISVLVYSLVSIWMYTIGMGAAIFAGTGDIAIILVRAGLGVMGLLIVVGSTVTTTFLDAYSAGLSYDAIWKKPSAEVVAMMATVLGTILAMVYPMDDITEFLYFIGSVFAPMISVLFVEYFVRGRREIPAPFDWINLAIWFLGFLLYRNLLSREWAVGSTLPAMALIMLITFVVGMLRGKNRPGKIG